MAKNSTRKVALSLVSLPHTGKKKKKKFHHIGLLGTPFPAPRKLAALCLQQVCSLNCSSLLWGYSNALAATRPQDLELLCSSELFMIGVFERKVVEQAASSHQREVLCAIGSNTSPPGKCVEKWGYCQITAPSVFQHSFLLQLVAGTSSSAPWRAFLFPPINPLLPHFPKGIT